MDRKIKNILNVVVVIAVNHWLSGVWTPGFFKGLKV